MRKAAEAFRSIGEVSQLVGVAPHVLRYWETQFPLFSPVKRRDGRRYYRPEDIWMAAGLCEVLREEGVSIRDAKKQMASDRGAALKTRGAARLEGATGDAGSAEAPDMATARPAKAKSARQDIAGSSSGPKTPATTRKSKNQPMPDSESLPLFPDLKPSDTIQPDAARAAPNRPVSRVAARPKPAPSSLWLARLTSICTDLRGVAAMPPRDSAVLLERILKARSAHHS
ncbi:MerR family transcriptional regulator [Paracoccus aerodenitrificans]|uniref:MerR family transcriptional regulator n=1 Tax=Paracoccus aerodenitrificans TaxID=3017781 RepID=UPI0022F1286E|nr:MerR family transcriptional regulator [Paracoccus aerodenitrificans]WBU65257.1 MerR family transcriptional regulator [Paracoccus aerodenitrificans]